MNTSEKIALNEVLKTYMLKDFKHAKSFCNNIIRVKNGFVDIVFYHIIAECCIAEGNYEDFQKNNNLFESFYGKPLDHQWRIDKNIKTPSLGDCVYFPKGRIGNDVSVSELLLFKNNLFKQKIGRLVLTDIAFDDLTEQSEQWFLLINQILVDIKKADDILLHIITGNSVEKIFTGLEAQKFQLNLFQWTGDKDSYNVLADRLFKRNGIIPTDYKDKWAFNLQIQEMIEFNDNNHVFVTNGGDSSLFVEPQLSEPTTQDWKKIIEIAKLAQDEQKIIELSLEKVKFMTFSDAKLLTETMANSSNIYLVKETDFMIYTLLQFIDQWG